MELMANQLAVSSQMIDAFKIKFLLETRNPFRNNWLQNSLNI